MLHRPLTSRRRYALKAFIGQVAFSGIAFVGSVLSARLLGPSGKGALTAWLLVANFGALVLSGTIPTGLGRDFLAGEHRRVLPVTVAHGAAAFAASLLVAVPAAGAGLDPITLGLLVVVTVPAGVVVQDLLVVLQAAKRPLLHHGLRIIGAFAFTAGLAGLYLHPVDDAFTAAAAFYALGAAASAVAAVVLARRRFGGGPRRSLRELSRLGRGSWTATLLDFALLRSDQWVVAALAGPGSLGLYSVAVNWAELGQYVGHSIGQALFEDERTLSRASARRILRTTGIYVTLLATLIAGAGFVLLGPIFGPEFESAKWALLFLTPGIPARTVGYAGAQMLLAQGRGTAVARITFLSVAVALALWTSGTFLFGISGAALASSLAYITQMLLIRRQLRR